MRKSFADDLERLGKGLDAAARLKDLDAAAAGAATAVIRQKTPFLKKGVSN